MTELLLVAEQVRASPANTHAVLCDGAVISWVGEDPARAPAASPQRVDLDGAVLQPAFVDAHAHLTATGLTLRGLDLRDCASVADCLAAVRAIADVTPGRVIWGSGWDDVDYPEGRPPTAAELTDAGRGRPVLLTRADGHSSVVDRTSLDAVPLARADGVERDGSGVPTGLLRREANHLARRWFLAELPEEQLTEAREAVATHAVSLGIASVHEMGGPDLMGAEDFDAWHTGAWPLEVVCYWGAMDLDFVAVRGLQQVGGDLFLDGTLGSRTAALTEDYADAGGGGALYQDPAELSAFLAEATRRRLQVGMHCIGDQAIRQAVKVLEAAVAEVGAEPVRRARHRLEHCELVPPDLIHRIAAVNAVASVQPGFDRLWGAPGGLYERRLGKRRAALMNPFRALHDAGVVLAIGSDANVTPMDPWSAVRAAVQHHNPSHRLHLDEALRAATIGGRVAARQDGVGNIAPGQRADLAAFADASDDPGSAVLTVVGGNVVHAS